MSDDSDTLAQLRRGSPVAFERVYLAEKRRVFGFLLRLCRDPGVAADLFQNTWLKLARSARSLREDTDLRAWLFTVARNEYRSHCRAQMLDMSRLLVLDQELSDDGIAATGMDSELAGIEAALQKLADADRELLLLVCVEGIEPQAAAKVLGISHAALRQRLTRARKKLLSELAGSELGAVVAKSRTP